MGTPIDYIERLSQNKFSPYSKVYDKLADFYSNNLILIREKSKAFDDSFLLVDKEGQTFQDSLANRIKKYFGKSFNLGEIEKVIIGFGDFRLILQKLNTYATKSFDKVDSIKIIEGIKEIYPNVLDKELEDNLKKKLDINVNYSFDYDLISKRVNPQILQIRLYSDQLKLDIVSPYNIVGVPRITILVETKLLKGVNNELDNKYIKYKTIRKGIVSNLPLAYASLKDSELFMSSFPVKYDGTLILIGEDFLHSYQSLNWQSKESIRNSLKRFIESKRGYLILTNNGDVYLSLPK